MKKKFKLSKRLLSILLAIAMVFGMQTIVSAADIAVTQLTVGGVDALTTTSGTNWSYDGVDTLTLCGDVGTILATGDLKIRLENDVTITTSTTNEPIKVYGSLTIDASGHTLTLDAVAKNRIALDVSKRNSDQTGSLTIISGTVVTCSGNTPAKISGDLTTGDSATLIANLDGSYDSVALTLYGNIYNNGTIVCNAKIRFNNSAQMRTVTNNGNLYYNGNNCANSSNLTVLNNSLMVTGVTKYDMMTNTVSISGNNAVIDVKGEATLSCNVTIPEGETAKLSGDSVLTVPDGIIFTNRGKVVKTEGASIVGTITGNQPELLVYLITFDGNVVEGGWIIPENMPSVQNVAPGNKVTEPENPSAGYGYAFAGWYTDPECTKKYDFDSVVTESMTLYARWGYSIAEATVILTPESGAYTGTAYTPEISVIWNRVTLVNGTDYEVSWDKTGYEDADTYTARIVGIGNFIGSVDKTFTVNAANLSDVKVEQVGTLTYNGKALTPTVSASAVTVNNQPINFF